MHPRNRERKYQRIFLVMQYCVFLKELLHSHQQVEAIYVNNLLLVIHVSIIQLLPLVTNKILNNQTCDWTIYFALFHLKIMSNLLVTEIYGSPGGTF